MDIIFVLQVYRTEKKNPYTASAQKEFAKLPMSMSYKEDSAKRSWERSQHGYFIKLAVEKVENEESQIVQFYKIEGEELEEITKFFKFAKPYVNVYGEIKADSFCDLLEKITHFVVAAYRFTEATEANISVKVEFKSSTSREKEQEQINSVIEGIRRAFFVYND